ncbi:hypothetical protein V6N13_083847 [Hibiscus sabdariffa]
MGAYKLKIAGTVEQETGIGREPVNVVVVDGNEAHGFHKYEVMDIQKAPIIIPKAMEEAINAPVGEPCVFGGESVVSAPESECHRRVLDLTEDRIVETFHVEQNNYEPCGSLQNLSGGGLVDVPVCSGCEPIGLADEMGNAALQGTKGGEYVLSEPSVSNGSRFLDVPIKIAEVITPSPCGGGMSIKLQKKDEKRCSRSRKQSGGMLPDTRVELDKWGRWKRSSRVQKRLTEKRKRGATKKQPSGEVTQNISDSEKVKTFRAAGKSKTWVDSVAEAEATLDLGNKMGVSFHAPSSEVLKRLQQLEVEEGVYNRYGEDNTRLWRRVVDAKYRFQRPF